MNVVHLFVAIIVCFYYFDSGEAFEPLLSLGGVALSMIAASTICRVKECCIDEYITRDLGLLRSSLQAELYDQHLAAETVLNALEKHLHDEKPMKPLAMSFHGSPGTGKTLMANLIVDALYEKGAKSNYVHYYNGYSEFPGIPLHEKLQIHYEIAYHLRSCPRSIFIFDKVDHMPQRALREVKEFLYFDIVPNQSIFIFISNIEALSIEERLISMWVNGKKREETKLEDFESLLVESYLNRGGGSLQTGIIKSNVMDYRIPFLPLEEAHVRKCIDTAFKRSDYKPQRDSQLSEMIDEVVMHLTFGPPPHNLYSESGCKRVDSKVSTIVEQRRRTNPHL